MRGHLQTVQAVLIRSFWTAAFLLPLSLLILSGCAAKQKMIETAATMGADHDEIGGPFARLLGDHFGNPLSRLLDLKNTGLGVDRPFPGDTLGFFENSVSKTSH